VSNEDDKPKLPGGADTLVPLGKCDDTGSEHMLAVKDGAPVAVAHMNRVEDGKPIPQDTDIFYVDSKDGRVIDSVRIGNGPAKVATRSYRAGWDNIFGKKKKSEKTLN
jgi:hypothetical protein